MARNKPSNKLSINDLVAKNPEAGKSTKSFNENIKDEFAYDEQLIENLRIYNETIANVDDVYKNLTTRFRVLVRVFTKNLQKDENGLIIPNTISLPIPTQNGVGNIGYVESPWPFSNKVIVIDAPEESTLKAGDICIMDKEPVTGILGGGKNVMLKVNHSFVHPDEAGKYFGGVPTDPTDKNYGFLLVNDFDLILKIGKHE